MAEPSRFRKAQEGDIFAIELGDGTFAFGQVAAGKDFAFFDLRHNAILPLEEIVSKNVIFRVWMVQSSIRNGKWRVLGNIPPQGKLTELAEYLNQPVLTLFM